MVFAISRPINALLESIKSDCRNLDVTEEERRRLETKGIPISYFVVINQLIYFCDKLILRQDIRFKMEIMKEFHCSMFGATLGYNTLSNVFSRYYGGGEWLVM